MNASKAGRLCHPLTPMQFNDLFVARPEVHTLSCGASSPAISTNMSALWNTTSHCRIDPPGRTRLREEMDRTLGQDWCQRWFEGLPQCVEVPGQVNLLEILRLWTYAKSLDLIAWGKCATTCSAKATTGSRGTPANSTPMPCAPLGPQPVCRSHPAILRGARDAFEAPKKRLSQS